MTDAVPAVAAAQARGGLPPDAILGTGDTALSRLMAGAAIDHAIDNRTSTRDPAHDPHQESPISFTSLTNNEHVLRLAYMRAP